MEWLSFVPLIIFAYYARAQGVNSATDAWKAAFIIGAIAAILQIAFFLYKKIRFDWISVGANAFLIYGALGFLTHEALLLPYAIFKQAVIFVFIFITGVLATLFSPDGFIQLVQAPRTIITKGSLILLASTIAVLVISYAAIQYGYGTLIAVILPFIGLIQIREFLRKYLLKL